MMVRLLLALALLAPASTTVAQSYPSKPVRFILPSAAGTPTDIMARAMAPSLLQALGQPFVVDNRTGANGIIGMEAFVRSAPDGYTLLVTQAAPVTLNPYFYAKLSYDPVRDIDPVINVGTIAASITAHASVSASSMKDLVELARRSPDTVLWATWGPGSFSDLYRVWTEATFGVKFREVPYKTPDQAFNAVLAGESQVLLSASNLFAPPVKAGKMHALATIGLRRSPHLPDTLSFAEQGLDLDYRGWVGVFAPAGTPRDVVMKVNAAIAKLVQDKAFVDKYLTPGSVEPVGGSPEDFAAFLRKDRETTAQLVKLARVKPQ
jgi:tripartite-type tricarboxylate transporter receptor subunit TctC